MILRNRSQLYHISGVVMLFEVATITLLPVLTWLLFTTTNPILPLEASHAQRALWFGYSFAALKFGHVLANLTMGLFADRYGCRLALLCAALGLLLIISVALLANAWQWPMLLLAGLFIGSLGNAVKPIGLAYVTDITTSDERLTAISRLQAFIAFGACVGPLAAGIVIEYSWQSGWVWMLLLSFVLLGMALLSRLPEKKPLSVRPRPSLPSVLGILLQKPGLKYGLTVLFLVQMSWAIFFEFSPAIAKYYFDFSALQIGAYIAVLTLSLVLTATIWLPVLRQKLSQNQLIDYALYSLILGLLLAVLACLNAPKAWAHLIFWFSAFFIASGDLIFYILIMGWFSKLTQPASRAQAIGALHVMVALIWMFAALLGGYLSAWLPLGVILFALANMLVLAGFLYTHRDRILSD